MSEEEKILLTGKAGVKGLWRLHQENGNIVMASEDETQSYIFTPADFHTKIYLLKFPGGGGKAHVLAELEKKKGSFELTHGKAEDLEEWLGPVSKQAMQAAINETTKFSLPIGIFFIVLAFVGEKPCDYETLILGVTITGFYVYAKLAVSPMVLLLDWSWFLLAICFIGYRILRGGSVLFIDIPLLVFFLLTMGLKWGNYKRFANYKEGKDLPPSARGYGPEKKEEVNSE